MKTDYKVTKSKKFTGVRVNLDGVKCTDISNGIRSNFVATGTVTIVKNGEQKDITGEHGASDYENEYGFILIPRD
jgi:hypothetical protein